MMMIIMLGAVNLPTHAQNIKKYDVDFENSNEGIVKVLHSVEKNVKAKVVIRNGENKYTYNISNDKEYTSLPLQMGNGNYTVAIYENTSGTKYKNVYTETDTVSIKSQNSIYLSSNQEIKWNKDDQAIILANKLAKTTKTEKEIVDAIYSYVIKNIDYDYNKIKNLSYDYIPAIDNVLQNGKGICYDYSVLLASMLRSQGIPTKLIKGYSTTTDVYHAWNEIYLEDEARWIIVDTTYDAAMVKGNKTYKMEKAASQYTKNLEY